MNLLSHAQTTKFLGIQHNFEIAFMDMHSQFHGAKFLGVQHASVKCSYYSQFLCIHSCKRNQKISYITMQNEGSGGTFVRYRYFHRSRASSFKQFTMFSAICININCTTTNLFLKTKKTTNHQTYKGYSGRHCII